MIDIIYNRKHKKENIKKYGEIFTPEHLVEDMLRLLPSEFFSDAKKTMLDPACGNGNFLVKILEWRMKNGMSRKDALRTIYGVDIRQENVDECILRLIGSDEDPDLQAILKNNIICANALDQKHIGWDAVGYMWSKKPNFLF